MTRLLGRWYSQLGYGSRALRSTPRRAALSSVLVIIFVAVQLSLLLVGAGGWALWIMPVVAIATWFALGSFWLTRDLVDAQIEAELREMLDSADPQR